MADQMWRFPDNNYTSENGLDTSDMEMFKKDPVSSLAREICQNSIDATFGEKPVRVEFSLFQLAREDVPGVDELEAQIEACYKYKKNSPKEEPSLRELLKSIKSNTITCLRVSDFNTTGIFGVNVNKSGVPFYDLTKGSGVSNKGGSSGGSKGIGKFASFVVSTTNTVFYSTKANDGTSGFIGISKLRSAPIPGEDENLLTIGVGYYAETERNLPVQHELHLDKNFIRNEKQYGTDVYIIGFNNFKGWQYDIIAKVLESFMIAVMRGELEVIVDGITVNQNTVKEIVYDEDFQKGRGKKEYREIRGQYELLQDDENVTVKELQIDENNSVTVYLKQYTQQDECNATKHCTMVRYPYMKITYIKQGAVIPFSALCVIPDNEINKKLRAIENPQHTDWEINRLNDFPVEKRNTRKIKKALEDAVKEFIKDVLRASSGESTDIEGAGEFLPSQEDFGSTNGNVISSEQIMVKPMKPVKAQTPKTAKSGEIGESYEFKEGELVDEGEPGKKPEKKPKPKPQPNPNPKTEPKDDTEVSDGKSPVLKKVPLSGMRYRTVVTDKRSGKYDCIFTSQYNENDCELAIRLCGEAADKYPVDIISASIDGVDCTINEGKIVGMRIEKGKTYKISYSVNSTEMFASEVILSAYR